ncbi:MAG: chromosomal replication initiator protein DnaA [Eubacterium sp.]|nr:chromosomal replication initiator protein DnaA [Eubacterium sp.]
MDTYNDILKAVFESCKPKISSTAFDCWLKDIKITGFDNNTFTIYLISPVKKKIVSEKYDNFLKKAFEEAIGFDVELKYECPNEESIFNQSDFEKDKENAKKVNETIINSDNLSPDQFTFDTFIEGPSNRFAYRAAIAVADNPGGSVKSENTFSNYNPLFIYGKSGLGKTHLLNAICYDIHSKYPALKILSTRSEDFTNEFIEALGKKRIDEFRDKFRNVDVLLIDDIQFIGGKDQTEEEFFHTFNALIENGKQIVLTSDRPPKEIKSLTERLCSRFENGLLADVKSPEYETRCAIIKRKAELLNFEVPDMVVEYIADKIKTNIRQLEGATKKLFAMSDLSGTTPSMALAQRVIKDVTTDTQPLPITVQKIVDEISRCEGVSSEQLYSKSRKANVVHARRIAIFIMREITNSTYEVIGETFGFNYSTVLFHYNELIKEMETDSKLKRRVEDMIDNIKSEEY